MSIYSDRSGCLLSFKQVSALINDGGYYACAADESVLARLPQGNWIGGTIPYFMGDAGGEVSRDKVYVQKITMFKGIAKPEIISYTSATLPQMLIDAPDHGFSIILVPANSQVHSDFSRNSPGFEHMYMKPLLGWVTGVHLEDIELISPKVRNGLTGETHDDCALVMHCALPENKVAMIDLVNLFEPGEGDTLTFPKTGFETKDCFVNGELVDFASYLDAEGIDTRLPLVADYCGAMVNVSIQSVDLKQQSVSLYAPVFPDVEYHFAKEVDDYVNAFQQALPQGLSGVDFSCNCILNYLYSELEGKHTSKIQGPMTFGEIAYQLVNQTLVYMRIEDL